MNDLLSTDLNTLDTSRTLIKAGLYDLRIAKAEVGQSSSGKRMATLTLETTKPAKSDKDKPVEAGHPLFTQVMLESSGGATPEIVSRNVAQLVQAVGGIPGATLNNTDQWVPKLNGKTLSAQVDLDPERERDGKVFDPRNNVRRFVKKG